MSKKLEMEEYLNKTAKPVMEDLLISILSNQPKNIYDYIEKYAIEKKTLSKQYGGKFANAYGENSEEEEDEEDEEVAKELAKKQAFKKQQKGRQSVSAEAFGKFNIKKAYVPKVIAKSEETKERIRKRLEQVFLFKALEPKELEIVIDSMEEKTYKAGESVIEQNDDGEHMYVIDQGTLDCTKIFPNQKESTFLKTYHPGENFGELALLYNAPRAATIKAKSKSVLFALDRECFNNIVKEAAQKQRNKYENFLTKVEILSSIDPYEKTQIADALKASKFKAGQTIIKQGDSGDDFFFIVSGTAEAFINLGSGGDKSVKNYKEFDYFGELALLKQQSRAATVKAITDCELVSLDRGSFQRLLGPLQDILKRNSEAYKKFVQ